MSITPEVTWAQRSSSTDAARNFLYVNINVSDVPKEQADLNITASNVSFTGTTLKGQKYHVSLDLYAEIDPENSKVHHTPRGVELVLRKKELKAEYWPRLLKDSKRAHFLKTDFDKWVDEDEQDDAPEDDYMNSFGGFGDDSLGGGDTDTSDDEEMPELEGDTPKLEKEEQPAEESGEGEEKTEEKKEGEDKMEVDSADDKSSKPKIEEVASS